MGSSVGINVVSVGLMVGSVVGLAVVGLAVGSAVGVSRNKRIGKKDIKFWIVESCTFSHQIIWKLSI